MAELMVDIDDVVFPLLDSIHDLARERGLHDGTVDPAWRGWEAYGCTEEEYWDLWADFALADGYLVQPPIPGAAEALRWLKWEGHKIHLVTARGFMANAEKIRAWTPQWIEEFAIPHDSLTFAKDKPAVMNQLGVWFDFAIDDSPSNYLALDNAGVDVYLLDHAHNRDFGAERRVASLWEWAFLIERSRA